MDTYTLVPLRVFEELFGGPSEAAAPVQAQANDAEIARSEENILQWMSYLPEDCVRTMIQMGWDITT
jgi:hypothetical protein